MENNKCRKCKTTAKPGICLKVSWFSTDDFGEDAGSRNTTLHEIYPGDLRKCLKCPTCGHSWIPKKTQDEIDGLFFEFNIACKIKPKSLKEQWFNREIAISPNNNAKLFKRVIAELIPNSRINPIGSCNYYLYSEGNHYSWAIDLTEKTPLISCEEMAKELFGEPVLITEDRVFIYEGDTYWYVDKRYPIINDITSMTIHNKDKYAPHKSFIRFSTLELAEEWVNENKIILTTEDNVKLKNKDNICIVNRHFSIKNEPISEYKVKDIQSYSTNYFAYFSTREAAELFIQQRDWKEGELYFVTYFIEEQKTPRIRVSAEHYGTFEIPGAIKDNTITWKYFEKCPNNFVLPTFN